MTQSDIRGKTAIVTGAGQGLGRQIAFALAAHGANVAVCDIKEVDARQTEASIQQDGGRAKMFVFDVSDDAAVRKAVGRIRKEWGHIDILVNNAGIDVTKPFDELAIEEWDKVLAVNVRGPFLLTKAVYDDMCHYHGGHIVNIVSTAAKRAWPEASAYHASKWGLLGFSHAMHTEARRAGVKVTAVVAGGMRTPFVLERFPDTDPSVLQDPANVAEVVCFVVMVPEETVIPEVMVVPMKETSWP